MTFCSRWRWWPAHCSRARGRVVSARRGRAVPAATVTTPRWEKKDVARNIPAYGGAEGPRLAMPPTAKPNDFLDLYFDDAVWDLMVDMTNRNAAAKKRRRAQEGVASCRPGRDAGIYRLDHRHRHHTFAEAGDVLGDRSPAHGHDWVQQRHVARSHSAC